MESYAPLLAEPRFQRLWSARVISRFGSALGYVVLIWYTYAETGSALAVVYVGLADFIPTILVGLFTGALVDRYERRAVIVLSTLARSAAMAALVLSLDLLGFHLLLILGASVLFSLCATFFGPASQALLPEIAAKEHLDRANGLFESTESIVGIAGSALAGGLIVTVGAIPSLGVDAAAYLVAAVLIALIGGTAILPSGAAPDGPILVQVREAFRYLRGVVGLLELTMATLVENFLFGFVLTFAVVYVSDSLHGTALVYGALEALLAAGWGLGGVLVSPLRLTRHAGRLAIASTLGLGLGAVALVCAPVVPVALPIFFGVGVLQGTANVAWLSTVQAIVPGPLQGRYFALDNALSYAAIPAAQIAGGLLILTHGLSFTFLLAGAGLCIAGLGFLALPDLRAVGYDARAPPPTPAS